MNNLKNIIFDLGGVVLNLDYSLTVKEFKKYIPDLDEETFLGKEKQLKFFSDYEIGLITSEEFKFQFEKNYHVQLSVEIFEFSWNAMLLDFPPRRVELIQYLRSQGKKLFLLSNINEIHEREVNKKFSELNLSLELKDLFHEMYYSHKISLRKPNEEIFNYVVKRNHLSLEETLFIDDSFQHIVGAKKIGLQTIHLKSPQTIEDIFSY